MSASVLSLGSINADFQLRVDRRPEVSENLVGRDFVRLGGGKAANVAYFARKLGLDARLLAHVGEDDLAEQALAPLREIGVDLSRVKSVAGHATGVALITVPPDGQKGSVLAANANDAWTRGDLAEIGEAIQAAPPGSVLVVDCEIPSFVAEAAAAAARQCALTVILDPSPADRVSADLLGNVDIVVPNASEAKTLTGIATHDVNSTVQAACRLLDQGAAAACLKMPDGGCVLAERGRAIHIPGLPVDVVDSTGAGDAFAGAMAAARVEGRDLVEAARFAAAASHLAVTGYGSQPAYPTRRDIEAILERLTASPIFSCAR